jgi:ATP diphosphatase
MTPLERLKGIMATLRNPDGGCPWDLEQTFATIAPYTLEESYEVADAIERGDMTELKAELGDLLFQTVFHARMAEEPGCSPSTTWRTPCPTSWSDGIRTSSPTRPRRATRSSRRRAGRTSRRPSASPKAQHGVLDDVPVGLPALARAAKLTKRAARVGFDWPSTDEVFDKLFEEVEELRVEIAAGDLDKAREEMGDLLFVVANLARKLGVEPEDALRGANAKFVRRFGFIEAELAKDGRTPDQSDLAEMDGLWDAAKAAEKAG